MSIKGKIYGKYLKRAKYVVKGRKLKTPIATLQKRVVEVKPNKEFNYVGEPIQKNEQKNKQIDNKEKIMEPIYNAKPQNVEKGKDISFSDLGKQIVEGENAENNKKGDSKTLMIVMVSLAIIIVAGMFQIGRYVYSEMQPSSKVASNDETNEKNEDANLIDTLLGNSDSEEVAIEDTVEETLEPSADTEATENNQEEEQLLVENNNEELLDNTVNNNCNTDNNKNNNKNNTSSGVVINKNNLLESLKGNGNVTTPSNPPTESKPTTPPKEPVTAGDDKKNYTDIGRVSSACVVYHVKDTSVNIKDVKNYRYSSAKFDNGSVYVLNSDLYGMFFYDDGGGVKFLKGYQSGVSKYVDTVILMEKNDDNYVAIAKYYVIDSTYIKFDDKYVVDPNCDENGKKEFYVTGDLVLYKE